MLGKAWLRVSSSLFITLNPSLIFGGIVAFLPSPIPTSEAATAEPEPEPALPGAETIYMTYDYYS